MAMGGFDLKSDIAEINAGHAIILPGGDVVTSSGRVCGGYPGKNSVFPREGPGLIKLARAEFGLFQSMLRDGGLRDGVLR